MKYDNYKVADLRNLCDEKGLSTSGTKNDLVKRLKINDENSEIKIDFNDSNEAIKRNDKTETLFIQLDSSNLFYYFNSGVFYPLEIEENKIYKNENRKSDLFYNFSQHIILLKKPLNHFNENEVLVEIIINDLNVIKINNVEGVYYTEQPIPISRVKSITFKTSQLAKSFLASAKSFPDSFIPDELCKIEDFKTELIYADLSKIELKPNLELKEWKSQLDRFDKIMGIFSFMKNSNIFSAVRDNHYQEYPNGYISLLSLINNNISPVDQKDLGLYRYILFPLEIEKSNVSRLLFRQIIDIIYQDLEFDFEISKTIIKNAIDSELSTFEERLDLNQILDALSRLDSHQISFKDVLALENVKRNYPILALLFLTKYSNKNKQHTDKQAVRNLFILNELNFNKSITEFILSILGLYYGYKRMIKSDTNLKLNDLNFESIAERQQSIKFKLESNLDRICIESIFEFSKFGEIQNYGYPYLKIKKQNFLLKKQFKNGNFEYLDNSFNFFDTKITSINRINKIDNVLKIIDLNYSNYIDNKSMLVNFIINNGILSKHLILELIKINSNKLNYEELIDLVEFDKKRNKTK